MTLDSLPDLDTSGLCLVKTLPTALTCWPYRNTALRDGARTSTRTSSVGKGRTASIHCRPAPPRQTEALSSRTSRSRPLKTSQPSGARAKNEHSESSVDLNTMIREAVELIAYPLRVDSIEVALQLAPHLPVLWADGHQLHQVVVNLVTNAHQALREREQPRRITVTTRPGAGRRTIDIQVADNGPGIPAEVRARIFEPFFTTKPVGKGTGLGLSLCQSIIADHGGTIEVASEPGHGAVFSISLPGRASDAAHAAEKPPAAAPGPPRSRILLLD